MGRDNKKRRWPSYLAIIGAVAMIASIVFDIIFNVYVSFPLFIIGVVIVATASIADMVVSGKIMTSKTKKITVITLVASSTFLAFICIAAYLGSKY